MLNPPLINVNSRCVPHLCAGFVSVKGSALGEAFLLLRPAARSAMGEHRQCCVSSAVRESTACFGGWQWIPILTPPKESTSAPPVPSAPPFPRLSAGSCTRSAVSPGLPSHLTARSQQLLAAHRAALRTTATPSSSTFLLVCTSYTVYNKVNQLHTVFASVCDILHINTAL